MERENTTELPSTTAASTGQGIFARPPPSGPILPTASSVSPGGNQSELKEQPPMSIASTGFVSQPVPSSVTEQWSSNVGTSLNVNHIPQVLPMLPNPPFGRPGTLAPPGHMTSPPAFPGSNPFSTSPRPGMSAGPAHINPGFHPHMYPPYHSQPGTPQGKWLQPPHMGGIPRAPFLSHSTPLPGSFPFPVRGMSPYIPYSGSQPLGSAPMGNAGAVHALPGHQLDISLGQNTEALSPIGMLEINELQKCVSCGPRL